MGVDTDPDLRKCIVEYAKGRGTITMSEICWNMDAQFWKIADQDEISRQWFMEGMVSKGFREIQTTYSAINGSNVSPKQWTTGVVVKLLEATHGQWLYRCIQVHDRTQGTLAMLRKEELQKEIKAQQEMGYGGLLEEDQYLAEVNLEDLETSSGERQEYWLVAIRATREAGVLRGAPQPDEGCNFSARDGRIIT